MSPPRRRCPWCVLHCLVALALAPGAQADADRWYQIALDGQPAGTAQESTRRDAEGTHSHSTLQWVLQRAGQRLEMDLRVDVLEDAQGLRQQTVDGSLAGDHYRVEAIVEGQDVHLQVSTAGRRYPREAHSDGPLWGPEMVRQQTLQALQHDGDLLLFHALSEDTGAVVVMERRLLGARTLDAPFRVSEQTSTDPHPVESVLDSAGYLLESHESSPLGSMDTRRTQGPPTTAALVGAPIGLAAQIPVDATLPMPRAVQVLELMLSPRGAALDPADFTGPGQHASARADGRVGLQIERVGADEASHAAPTPAEREANALYNSDAPEIDALVQQLTTGLTDDDVRIDTLVGWVTQHLHFDPGFAIASALDVLHHRRGTCVAYATLAATLLRSAGYPARVVYGYAYAEGAFVGHAWTEVWRTGQWRAVDAALVGVGTADAARIALGRSDGHWGPLSGLDRLAQSFGRFDVAIGAYVVNGVRTDLSAQTH